MTNTNTMHPADIADAMESLELAKLIAQANEEQRPRKITVAAMRAKKVAKSS